jgi:hypothetical protein
MHDRGARAALEAQRLGVFAKVREQRRGAATLFGAFLSLRGVRRATIFEGELADGTAGARVGLQHGQLGRGGPCANHSRRGCGATRPGAAATVA